MTRILIADGQHVARRGLRVLLESRAGWNVVSEAADGYEAIEEAGRTLPDVAVMEWSLPHMNGFEVTRRIRQKSLRTEVCIFTHCLEESLVTSALCAGARGFVLKSDKETELLEAVEALSRHKRHFSWAVPKSILEHFAKHNGHSLNAQLLTPREREVVQLVAEGLSNKQVGRHLYLSVKTVESHRGAAMRKAGVSSTADLVRYAVRNHLVEA